MTPSTLKALLEKCTPGKWNIRSQPDKTLMKTAHWVDAAEGEPVASMYSFHRGYSHHKNSEANAALIAAARNELPGILAENEKLREALAEIKEIYIGSEGFHAETCPEAYLQMKFRETYDTACEALKEIKP